MLRAAAPAVVCFVRRLYKDYSAFAEKTIRLRALLGLTPGSVTPPGVLNDTERRVHVFLDAAFLEPPARIGVHPNDNTATVWLHTKDLIALIEEHGNALTITEL